ncbi:MAG: DMT family transporter [Alphaproteobacteria bacterium]|nr:MAG: DMT family transporter [Alphaproteobacteria bacterium]TAF75298.1 MAG: DMT family transporter [Alphaproteobacteria bacterium]
MQDGHNHLSMPYIPERFYGIALFVVAMFFFSCMNVTISSMAGSIPSVQIVFMRNILGLCMLAPFMIRRYGVEGLRTKRIGRHAQRAFVGLLSMEAWFYSLGNISVNTATALSFSAPLFSTVLAVLLLKERIRALRIAALLVGFGGVVLIASPTREEAQSFYSYVVLFSALMMAYTGIIVKKLTVTEPSWRIVIYMTAFMSMMSFPLAWMEWQPIEPPMMGMLVIVALCSIIAQICLTHALKLQKIVVLTPFEFTRLMFTAMIAWIIFGEQLTWNSVVGSVIILSSAVFIAWRESYVKKKKIVL